MSYNIHHGEGIDRRLDLERIAAVIADSGADIVALQELDQSTRRTGGVAQTEVLAHPAASRSRPALSPGSKLKRRSAKILNAPTASDHLPVMVTYDWPEVD